MYARPDPFAAEAQATPDPALGEVAEDQRPMTLADMGEKLLEIVQMAAVARGVKLPGRQSVYMAPIPADCEQVAVLITTWTPTPPPDGPTICQPWRWMAPMSVIITRCSPAAPVVVRGKASTVAPKPEKMTEAARLASADAEVFLEVVNRLNEIGGDVGIVTNPASGGFQTVELNIQLLPTGSF